jgi:hypothetical protein
MFSGTSSPQAAPVIILPVGLPSVGTLERGAVRYRRQIIPMSQKVTYKFALGVF